MKSLDARQIETPEKVSSTGGGVQELTWWCGMSKRTAQPYGEEHKEILKLHDEVSVTLRLERSVVSEEVSSKSRSDNRMSYLTCFDIRWRGLPPILYFNIKTRDNIPKI